MACKNICRTPFFIREFEIKGLYGAASFSRGFKKCSTCRISLKNAGNFCPCCNMILRTNPRHKKRQQNPLTILKRLARPHNLIVVAGVAGSGKTVLAGQLGADRIFDDLHYNMFPSGKLMMQTITDEILLAKNNNKKIVTCIVREMPSVLQQLDTAYFFVGVSPLIRQRYDSFIDAELLRKQERRYRRSCQKKRKQRPYLFVSKNTHHFGWFKFKGEEK